MITSKAIIENKTSLWANKKCNSAVMSSCHQAIVQFLQSQSKAVVKMPPSFDKAIIKQLQAWNFHQAMFNIGKRSLSWCKLSRNCYKTVRNINISNCINKFWVGIILSQSDINQYSKVWLSQLVTRLANALCVDPHCKVSIGQCTKMCTSPLIFFHLHYFRWQIFEENIWSLSLS